MFLIAVGLLVGGAVNMQYSFFVSEQTRRWMLSFSRYEVTDYLVVLQEAKYLNYL